MTLLLEAHEIVDALNKSTCNGKRSVDGSVDLTLVVREESHCHQADQPCLLGLLLILLTLFYLLSMCVRVHTRTHSCTVSTHTCHNTHLAMGEKLSGVGSPSWVLGPVSGCQACREEEGWRETKGGRAFAVSLTHLCSCVCSSSCFSTLGHSCSLGSSKAYPHLPHPPSQSGFLL